jgi:hypothetical protein
MKKLYFCIFILFFLNSCYTYEDIAVVTIINNSSYDLHIKFTAKRYESQYKAIDIRSNESISFDVSAGKGTFPIFVASDPSYPNPNDDVEKMVFLDLNTSEFIKEIISFKFIGSGDKYQFIITDGLLYGD